MKTKFSEIAKDGISFSKGQIKKLESEIKKMLKLKKSKINVSSKSKIDEIIKWDKKLISDFKKEISILKKRL